MDDLGIELRHLRYFVAVAEELHFGRAAERLHLAQPPLSQQIRKLEEMLGYPLFTRTSRNVRLTSAGEVLLERARRTLRGIREDLDEVRSVARGEIGFLKVGFVSSIVLTALPAMLGTYRRQHAQVHLQLQEFYTSGVMAALSRGTLDTGFLRDGGPAPGLVVETLFQEPYVAVVPSDHALARRSEISVAFLRDEPFVFFSPSAGSRAYEKAMSLCEEHGFRPEIVQEASQWLTVLRLVGVGMGVTIAPACVKRIAGPDVACLHLLGAGVESEVELACREGEDRAIVAAFAAMARAQLGPKPSRRVGKNRTKAAT